MGLFRNDSEEPLNEQPLLFCWIPADGAERPQSGNKRGVSPVSDKRCKRRRSSATIANCNTYSPHLDRNSRGASGLKPTPTAPLLTSRGCHECQPGRASQQSTGLFRAYGTGVHPPRRLLCHWQRAAPHPDRNSRGASGLKPTPTAPLLTAPPPRFIPHSGHSAPARCAVVVLRRR